MHAKYFRATGSELVDPSSVSLLRSARTVDLFSNLHSVAYFTCSDLKTYTYEIKVNGNLSYFMILFFKIHCINSRILKIFDLEFGLKSNDDDCKVASYV